MKDDRNRVSGGPGAGRLKIAAGLEHADTLTREFHNFIVTINSKTAPDRYCAWRKEDHDDLVLALALATWTRDWYWEHMDDALMIPAESVVQVAR